MNISKEKLEELIDQLESEADACEEIGSNFAASEMRDEAERLRKLLTH